MHEDPLLSPEQLQARLGEADLRILDATWFMPGAGRDARAEYEAAHLPGAVWFDIDGIADRETTLPHMLPTAEAFAEAAGALELSDGDFIVVYDRDSMAAAARVWWTLRAFGAERVRVLDGGLKAWTAAGGALDTGGVTPRPSVFSAAFQPALVRNVDGVSAALGGGQVLDARPAARFRGEAPEPRAGLRSGHMPGARNLPFPTLLDVDGRLRPADELRALFEAAGIDLERPVVTTCGSGVTAALLALALARLGRFDTAVYDGSWAEWGGRADTAVATGA